MAKLKATFCIGDEPAIIDIGRDAQIIIALVKAGPKGLTSLEMHRAGWAWRLSAYLCDLQKMDFPIQTGCECHDVGNHERYFLAGPVQMMAA